MCDSCPPFPAPRLTPSEVEHPLSINRLSPGTLGGGGLTRLLGEGGLDGV